MTHFSIKNVARLKGHENQGFSCSLFANDEKIADLREWGLSNLEYSNVNEAQLNNFFTFIDSLKPQVIFDTSIPVSDWTWVYNLAHRELRMKEFQQTLEQHIVAANNDEILLWDLTEDEEDRDIALSEKEIHNYIQEHLPDALSLNYLPSDKAFEIWEKIQFPWTTKQFETVN